MDSDDTPEVNASFDEADASNLHYMLTAHHETLLIIFHNFSSNLLP